MLVKADPEGRKTFAREIEPLLRRAEANHSRDFALGAEIGFMEFENGVQSFVVRKRDPWVTTLLHNNAAVTRGYEYGELLAEQYRTQHGEGKLRWMQQLYRGS